MTHGQRPQHGPVPVVPPAVLPAVLPVVRMTLSNVLVRAAEVARPEAGAKVVLFQSEVEVGVAPSCFLAGEVVPPGVVAGVV